MLSSPLAVRIDDGITDRHVTAVASGLKFRKTAPGGHHSASLRIEAPISAFRTLGPADRLTVYDARTGRTLFSGYCDNPGREYGSGEGFDLTAMGSMHVASDRRERLLYLTQSFEDWAPGSGADGNGVAPSATTTIGTFPEAASSARKDQACVYLQFNPGQPIATGSRAAMMWSGAYRGLMSIGAVAGWREEGIVGGGYDVRLQAEPYVSGDGRIVANTGATTTGAAFTGIAGTHFPTGKNGLTYLMVRTLGAINIATDTVWSGLDDLVIYGHLVDRYGNLRSMGSVVHVTTGTTTAIGSGYILAKDVVEDLLGRVLTQCDSASADVVASTSAQISELTFPEFSTAAQVFDALAEWEPDHYWGVGEVLPNGLHKFWYRKWDDTSVRYEISVKDGYSAPGGDLELFNRMPFSYVDAQGVTKTQWTSTAVDELGPGAPGS